MYVHKTEHEIVTWNDIIQLHNQMCFLQQAVLCSLERWREGEATFQAVCSATYLPVILPSLANYHHLYLCHFHLDLFLDLYSYLDLKPPINPSFLPATRRVPLLEIPIIVISYSISNNWNGVTGHSQCSYITGLVSLWFALGRLNVATRKVTFLKLTRYPLANL